MSSYRTTIAQEVIEGMIDRHIRSYFRIGDLYQVTIADYSKGWNVQNLTVPLLDTSTVFDYRQYCDLCNFGKSINRHKLVYEAGSHNIIYPYHLNFSYSFWANDKVVKKDMRLDFHDPIWNNQTMNSKIAMFAMDCIKVLKNTKSDNLFLDNRRFMA